ncbi:hypothetical protein JHK85_003037 [Glycine max]|nr:hypothetical protein JHK85_003037 [Glycine max]KAG5078818.1 hypothetical protein JHK86_002883 [Glycine max]
MIPSSNKNNTTLRRGRLSLLHFNERLASLLLERCNQTERRSNSRASNRPEHRLFPHRRRQESRVRRQGICDSNTVDCREITKTTNNTLTAKESDLFSNQFVSNLEVKRVVFGEGFTCGEVNDVHGGLICWGPTTENLGNISNVSDTFGGYGDGSERRANPFCGVRMDNHEVECWGDLNSYVIPK